MDHSAHLPDLVDSFYAAAVEPGLWPAVLERLAALLACDHTILTVPARDDHGGLLASYGVSESALARSVAASAEIDAGPFRLDALPDGVVQTRAAIMPDAEFERTATYNEMIRPLNGFHSLHVRNRLPAGFFAVIACRSRRSPDFDPSHARALAGLVPHLATALDVHRRLRAHEAAASGMASVLDTLDHGVILTDAAARPLFANRRAMDLAAEADGLTVEETGLAAAWPDVTRRLRCTISAAASCHDGGPRRMCLKRPSGRRPLIATIVPAWRLSTLLPGAPGARAAVIIEQPDEEAAPDLALLADAFGLTPREGEVAALLVAGLELNAVAARLGLAPAPARSHLKRIFDKTGTHSQVALVALLRAYLDPAPRLPY